MRILFVSPRQCWPPVTGARLREYHLLKALSQRAEVSYAFYLDPDTSSPAANLSWCRDILPIGKPRMYTPAKVFRGTFSGRALPIVNYDSPQMNTALRKLLSNKRFELAHLDSIHMLGCESLFPSGTNVVYDWHNIESELMNRYAENTPSLPRKMYARRTAALLAKAERGILQSALGHVVCSEREREQLLRYNPHARIAVIENGVDTAYFARDTSATSASPNRVLFVGSMSYHANIEAAVSFAREFWPPVHQRFPEWKFTIVGSSPTAAVLALGELAGVEVTGTVPDVRPYYNDAIASVVPIRTGGGTRLKILEAMAAGVPVISTRAGAEGLAVTEGEDILFAENDWVGPLETVATDTTIRRDLVAAALRLMRSRYDWEIIGEGLYDTYIRWLQ